MRSTGRKIPTQDEKNEKKGKRIELNQRNGMKKKTEFESEKKMK